MSHINFGEGRSPSVRSPCPATAAFRSAIGSRRGTAYEIPEVAEIDELHTYVNEKNNKKWLWRVVNHFKPGIITWVLGDRSAATFKPLWDIIKCWQCFFYVTDGWPVYRMFIEDIDQIVSKTYMTRFEGENCRLRHYLARLKRKTLCYSKSE